MEIKTKFNIGDVAYCMINDKIVKVKITKITVNVTEIFDYNIGDFTKQQEQYNFNTLNGGECGIGSDELLFESLDACVKHLINNVK